MEHFGGNPFVNIEQRKRSLREKVTPLFKGNPISEIARLLDADEFIEVSQNHKQAPVKRFNIDAFVERELSRSDALLLPDSYTKLETTIIPPDEGEMFVSGEGDAPFREKKIFPRSYHLVELLTALKQSYSVTTGTNKKNMMRGESYQAFSIPGLGRAVLLNDEEGNATFVISVDDPTEIPWLMSQTKNELKSLGDEKIRTLHYPGSPEKWKTELSALLTESFVDSAKNHETASEANSETPNAPDGWMNEFGLSRYLGITRKKTGQLIRQYLDGHPEWRKSYKNGTNMVTSYYHPDLIEACQKYVSSLPPKAPAGWKTNEELAVELGVSNKLTGRLIKEYVATHPEWLHSYTGVSGVFNFIDPDLVQLIRHDIEAREVPPEGWMSRSMIARTISTSKSTVFRLIDRELAEYRVIHPEWFGTYHATIEKTTEFFSPELVKALIETLAKREVAPSGWETLLGISSELKKEMDLKGTKYVTDRKTIKKIVDEYRISNSDWFMTYKTHTSSGRYHAFTEHFHPDLIRLVKERLRRSS